MRRCEEVRLDLPTLLSGELGTQAAISMNIHLRECTACTRELEELRGAVEILLNAPLQYDADPDLEDRVFELTSFEGIGSLVSSAPLDKEPPIDLEARSLVRAGVLDSIVDPRRSRWSKVAMVLAPSLAAAAIVAGFLATEWRSRFIQLENVFGEMGRPLATQQLTSFDTSNSARAELFDSSATQETYHLVLRTNDLPATPDGFRYELWLSGSKGMVSAGSFSLQGASDEIFVFTVSVSPWEYPDVEITLEPDDGDPAHTGTTVMEASFNLP